MNKDGMILELNNALLLLDTVETKGEKNLNALLASMQRIRRVRDAVKEEKNGEKCDDA